MESHKHLLWKLFLSTFYLSAFTFGGGYVIVTLMKKKFVDQYHWIEEDEMLDLIAIAQSAPGRSPSTAPLLPDLNWPGSREFWSASLPLSFRLFLLFLLSLSVILLFRTMSGSVCFWKECSPVLQL